MEKLPKGLPFSAYSNPSFKFWFEEDWYTVQGAKTMLRMGTKDDLATMRSEYTRMRDVAQKRIKRLQRDFPETAGAKRTTKIENEKGEVVREYSGFPKLRDIKAEDFAYAFSELAKFVRAKGSSVTGQRSIQEKTTATLNKAIGVGTDLGNGKKQVGVTKKNYWMTIKLLEELRKQKLHYGSKETVELAEMMIGLDDQQIEDWLAHLDDLLPHTDELQEIPDLAGYDFDEIKDMLGD